MRGRANRRCWASILVATDSEKVQEYCASHGIPVMRTRRHPSGSDRLHEVMERTDADLYVNIQGDEPTVRADQIELLLRPLLAGESEVTTLKVAIDEAAAQNPNVVKVVTDTRWPRALFFAPAYPLRPGRHGRDPLLQAYRTVRVHSGGTGSFSQPAAIVAGTGREARTVALPGKWHRYPRCGNAV